MKLSKTQNDLINKIKEDIDTARKFDTYKDYFNQVGNQNNNCAYKDYETVLKRDGMKYFEYYINHWNNLKNGIVLTWTSSSTLRALENKGLIEIIEDAGNGVDHIKLLNY